MSNDTMAHRSIHWIGGLCYVYIPPIKRMDRWVCRACFFTDLCYGSVGMLCCFLNGIDFLLLVANLTP